MRPRLTAAASVVLATAALAAPAAAQEPTVPPPAPPAEQPPEPPSSGRLDAPRLLATGVPIALRGRGATPRVRLVVELRTREGAWKPIARVRADGRGRYGYTLRTTGERRVRPLRARALASSGSSPPRPTRPVRVRARDVTLAAAGDVNLGDGVATVMAGRGDRYPWSGVAPTLRRADIAFANLECAVSRRGAPVPKTFTFRGRPEALRTAGRYAGIDVWNLANNHVGDYGGAAMADTAAWVRKLGMRPVGYGRDAGAAATPRIVRRLGLRVAFVGFSEILPADFWATSTRQGVTQATVANVTSGVRSAARRADVVVAAFHWGIERSTTPTARQRELAGAAVAAGADAVIGAHPHVLQPVERGRGTVTAYSLGNFVWAAGSPLTARTGILALRLTARGVRSARLLGATISNTRPALDG